MRMWMGVAMAAVLAAAGCGSKVNPRVATTPNHAAALRGNLPADPLRWQVITSEIDTKQKTMSTLFGNDAAIAYARSHADANYPAGAVLALATWSQQEDARWFGARIPAAPRSVEFVAVNSGSGHKTLYKYSVYEGAPLALTHSEDAATPQGRAAYLLGQRAAVMP